MRARYPWLRVAAASMLALGGCESDENRERDVADTEPETTPDVDDGGTDADVAEDPDTSLDGDPDTAPDGDATRDAETNEVDTGPDTEADTDTGGDPCGGSCRANERCDDSGETPVCVCPEGLVDTEEACTDIDECAAEVPPCSEFASCLNIVGSFACDCDEGYTGDGFVCENIDECASAETCAAAAECVDVPGSYLCLCPPGQIHDVGTCVDANECDGPVMPTVTVFHARGDAPDCIGDSVCIDRAGSGPIFNSLVDEGGAVDCAGDYGPTGTEWHAGPCSMRAPVFGSFGDVAGCAPKDRLVGQTLCMHLVDDDRYFDVDWTYWGVGVEDEGGYFGYSRTEVFPSCGPGTSCADEVGGYTCSCNAELSGDPALGCVDADVCDGNPCGGGNACFPKLGGGFGCICEGLPLLVTKEPFAEVVDCIAPGLVCLTRGDRQSLYNTLAEPFGFAGPYDEAPARTWWTATPCADAEAEAFGPFIGGLAEPENIPSSIVGVPACMTVGPPATSDVWIDITFTRWDDGSTVPGGGYAYERDRTFFDTACPTPD